MLRSPQITIGCGSLRHLRRELLERRQEAQLRRVVLAAVRHVDRHDGDRRQPHDHDPILVVEGGMGKSRPLRRHRLADVQGHARIALLAVPIAPVAVHLTERRRDLIGRRLDFLEADDVGTIARDPFLQLRLTRANAVDVPGRYSHGVDHLENNDWPPGPQPARSGGAATGAAIGQVYVGAGGLVRRAELGRWAGESGGRRAMLRRWDRQVPTTAR